jgi:transposase
MKIEGHNRAFAFFGGTCRRGIYDNMSTTVTKVPHGKTVAYALNQWHRLVGYIEEGNLTIDNNLAENSIRPFVVGRKNRLFSGTPEGAEVSALLYSLIETAKANKLEPNAYLRYIFEKLPMAASLEEFEALLPWQYYPEANELFTVG